MFSWFVVYSLLLTAYCLMYWWWRPRSNSQSNREISIPSTQKARSSSVVRWHETSASRIDLFRSTRRAWSL